MLDQSMLKKEMAMNEENNPFEPVAIASGLRFPEGPVALRDGSLLVLETAADTLVRIAADGQFSRVSSSAAARTARPWALTAPCT
jgi:hypothetical protein